jgi:hypothetical protein
MHYTISVEEVNGLVLGEKVGEAKGKMIGLGVKSVGPEGIRMESDFVSENKGFGRFPSGRNMGTSDITTSPSGIGSGTGQGMFTTLDGDSIVWKNSTLSKTEEGKMKVVSLVQFMTASPKFSWMNSFIMVAEAVIDMKTMEAIETDYEWK